MATTSSSSQATAQLSQRKPQGHLSVTFGSVIAHPVVRWTRESRPFHVIDRDSREHESTRIGDICVYVCRCVFIRLDLVFQMGPTA
jgi:hypothetical protein